MSSAKMTRFLNRILEVDYVTWGGGGGDIYKCKISSHRLAEVLRNHIKRTDAVLFGRQNKFARTFYLKLKSVRIFSVTLFHKLVVYS